MKGKLLGNIAGRHARSSPVHGRGRRRASRPTNGSPCCVRMEEQSVLPASLVPLQVGLGCGFPEGRPASGARWHIAAKAGLWRGHLLLNIAAHGTEERRRVDSGDGVRPHPCRDGRPRACVRMLPTLWSDRRETLKSGARPTTGLLVDLGLPSFETKGRTTSRWVLVTTPRTFFTSFFFADGSR